MRFFVERGAAGLFADPGLGKTSVTLAAFKLLRERGFVQRALVVAPLNAALTTWPDEVARWRDFAELRLAVLHGPRKDDALTADADVYVINPEGLPWFEREWKRSRQLEMLVVDESTKFKSTRTLRFKTLKRLLPKFQRRYILTGTPAPNGLLDLFGQVYVLDFGESLGRFITRYRQHYFYPTGYGGYTWLPRPGAETEIYERLQPLVLRLDEQDHLQLPPVVDKTIACELPPRARRTYRELETEFVTRLRAGEVTAVSAGALTSKLRQVANGGVYLSGILENQGAWESVHDAKVDALADLVEELSGQPLLVAYEFTHDVPRIQAKLGGLYRDEPIPGIGGGTPTARRREYIERWNRGELPLLLVHPASAAHGLNLQAGGNHVAWFGLTYDLEHYEQLIRRLRRSGQRKRVFVYHLVARNTIDVVIRGALRRKAKSQRELLDALREAYA